MDFAPSKSSLACFGDPPGTIKGPRDPPRDVNPFETLWEAVRDPREQMQLAVLYLTLQRDLRGVVLDRDGLAALMARRHRWSHDRTVRRLERLVDLGLVVKERGLVRDAVVVAEAEEEADEAMEAAAEAAGPDGPARVEAADPAPEPSADPPGERCVVYRLSG